MIDVDFWEFMEFVIFFVGFLRLLVVNGYKWNLEKMWYLFNKFDFENIFLNGYFINS